jgi:hypothetical protein
MAEETESFMDDFGKKIKEVLDSVGEVFKSNIDPSRITAVMEELDVQASKVIATFGQGRENIVGIKQAMADAVVSVKALGGSFQDVLDTQNNIANTLGRNLVLASDSYKDLYAAAEASDQSSSTIVESFKNVGISVYDSSKQIEGILNTAREIGVSGKLVTGEVLNNMDLLNKYTFQGGVDGLAKMAAQAVNLRINVNAIGATLDKAFNPESAIEMAAAMQRLGATQSDLLDPLRLMDLAQNDPAELQNQIAEMSKQFVELNEKGQFEIMPGAKRQMKEIADAMGMDISNLTKMAIGSAELEDKMSKISFPDTFTEEQKTMIANMAEMEGGEYKIQLGGDKLGIAEAIERLKSGGDDAMQDLMDSAKPKTLEELTKEQLGYTAAMKASLSTLEDRIPYAIASMRGVSQGQTKLMKGTEAVTGAFDTDALSVKTIRNQFNDLYEGVSGSISQNGIDFENLSASINKFGDYFNTSFTESFKNLDEKVNEAVGYKITEILKKMDESLNIGTKSTETKTETPTATPIQTVTTTPPTSTNNNLAVNNLNTTTTENKTNTNVSENKNISQITLDINVNSSNVDKDKVIEIISRTEVVQAINSEIKKLNTTNGLTTT